MAPSDRLGDSALVLAAGLPRSACTWLYNAARLLLVSDPRVARSFACGWIDDRAQLPASDYLLLKLNDFVGPLVAESPLILYSYRDLRDVLASLHRKFAIVPTLETCDYLVDLHHRWTDVADAVIRYEDLLSDQARTIKRVARVVGVQESDAHRVTAGLAELHYGSPGKKHSGYHRINLYQDGHFTDGRHGSWTGVLSPALLATIERKHADWFMRHGYPLGSPSQDRRAAG